MAASGHVEVEVRVRLSRALRTTAREVLLRLYKQRFRAKNGPNAAPITLLNAHGRARQMLNFNRQMERKILRNKIEEFDVTILYLLLKNICGLQRNEAVWRDSNTIEGNIEILHLLRNEDAHWTQDDCSLQDLEAAWTSLESALTMLLLLTGQEEQLPTVQEELRKIRSGEAPEHDNIWKRKRINGELKKLYRGSENRPSNKTKLQPLVWTGADYTFHHQVDHTYTPTKLTTLIHGEVKEVGASDVLGKDTGKEGPQVTVVQGESGTGKTSLLRHYANSWAAHPPSAGSPMAQFDYTLFLDLTAVAKGTFSVQDMVQELLPNTYKDWEAKTIINELARSGEKLLVMVDAFDERYDAFKDTFKELLKKCPKASFLVTTRPHCTQGILKLCDNACKVFTTHGFSRRAAMDYAEKLLHLNGRKDELHDFINAVSPYKEILAIPQLLCWSCWFWLEHGEQAFKTRGKIFANLTDFLLRKLCHINGKRVMARELPEAGQKWFDVVAGLAFTMTQRDQVSLNNSSMEIKKLEEHAEKHKLRPAEALSTLMQCDSNMAGKGEQIVYQFVHESHACFLVGHHIIYLLQNKIKKSLIIPLKKMKQKQQKLILLFLVSMMFDGENKVEKEVVNDMAIMARQFVSINDIRYYLDLVEESGHNQQLSRALALQMPMQPNLESISPTGKTTWKGQTLDGKLLLHPRDLEQSKALLPLLQEAKPARVWLRMCEGPRNDETSPVLGHKVVKRNPEVALKLLALAYLRYCLPELILTDCIFSTQIVFPNSIWWLTLQRCNIMTKACLPIGQYKLKLTECENVKNLEMYDCNIAVMTIECCTCTSAFQLPCHLQKLKLKYCEQTDQLIMPHTLKHLIFQGLVLPKLPSGLTTLHISLQSSILGKVRKQDSENIMWQIKEAAKSLPFLMRLQISDMVLTPADFVDLLLVIQDSCSRCFVEVKSQWHLPFGSDEGKAAIEDAVQRCRLPVVAVVHYKGEVINNIPSFLLQPACMKVNISSSDQAEQTRLPQALESLEVEGHYLPTLPNGLKALVINMPHNSKPFSCWQEESFGLVCQIKAAARSLKSLQRLIIINTLISPNTFVDLLQDFQKKCPKCHLELRSHWCFLHSEAQGRKAIVAAVKNSSLPSIKVFFQGEEIVKNPGINSLHDCSNNTFNPAA